MTTRASERRDTVIILGGRGGYEARYRELAREYGFELKHYEQRLPPKSLPDPSRIAMVIVMVSMISHPLRAQARKLADAGATLVYLKATSVAALRETVAEHAPSPSAPATRAARQAA